MNKKESFKQTYERARGNLLLVIIFTVINAVLIVTDSANVFLFSATLPYLSLAIGIYWRINFCIVIAVLSIVVYLLCWIFSKKRVGWMIVSLAFFIADTLILIGFSLLVGDYSGILNFLVHIWVIYYLVTGTHAGLKLKNMPEDDSDSEEHDGDIDSVPLRIADMTVKHRVLLETDASGYGICYRRVNKINELIINGYIYDELKALIEPRHTLSARLGGHLIQAGYDGARSFISVDGKVISKRIRIW